MGKTSRRRLISVGLASLALVAAGSVTGASHARSTRSGATSTCPPNKIKPVGTRYKRGVNCRTVDVDGYPRLFIVYVPTDPDFDPNLTHPLVLMFHGTGGDGEKFYKISGWKEMAEREGLIAVFPTGLKYLVLESGAHRTKWNGYELAADVDPNDKPNGYPDTAPWPANDVGFVDMMLEDIQAQGHVDPERIFESGFSNGSQFCNRLAVERSDVFAAAACASGALGEEHSADLVAPIPTAFAAGSMDENALETLNTQEGSNLTELPLTYDEFVDHEFLANVLNVGNDTFGLSRTPTNIVESSKKMFLTFLDESDPGDNVDRCSSFTLWQGVTHQYPNGKNNPHHFVAAKYFWRFFETTWNGCPAS